MMEPFRRSVIPEWESLHEEVRWAAKGVVRVLNHSGGNLVWRIDLILGPFVGICLVVLRATSGTAIPTGATVVAASAVRAAILRAGSAVFAGGTSTATGGGCAGVVRGVNSVAIGVIALLSGVVPAFVSEVVVTKAVIDFEITMSDGSFGLMSLFAVSGSAPHNRPHVRSWIDDAWGLSPND